MVRWPSGLRRQTKDLVRKGVGSNPTLIISIFFTFAYTVHATHVCAVACRIGEVMMQRENVCHLWFPPYPPLELWKT